MSSHVASPVEEWILRVAPSTLPPDVVAFAFNLSESGNWLVDLTGASSYDPLDEDWACPPAAWSSLPHTLQLPQDVAGASWEAALDYVVASVARFLQAPSAQSAVLRSAEAICVGFVDGNLVKVWPLDEA